MTSWGSTICSTSSRSDREITVGRRSARADLILVRYLQTHDRAAAEATRMTRWSLNRAGILNVYQYGDETIRFSGGRLLLRGVNGSGKSTAMNMLLPFLLDADPRRIDAAGEQASVLRGWMLSGRDEQQPVGYLWLEVREGDDPEAAHLVFGCGIRANRSTDRVTTWWFITHRRPGIDLSLLDAKTPLSVEALRAELGPTAVFTHEQRASYRAEIRRRLFGGADIDQHLRLLHIVRNPRVGDRIDIDLPTYLADALPQLSEAALDDAAQPLEDLEEHRRNVEALIRTSTALEAMDTTYGNYVRTELHARADSALAQATATHRLAANLTAGREELAAAEAAAANVRGATDRLEHEVRRLGGEIDALRSQPAYQDGSQLQDLREHVASLDDEIEQSTNTVNRHARRASSANDTLAQAHRQSTDDHGALTNQLSDLRRLAETSKLRVAVPDVPPISTASAIGTLSPEHELELDPATTNLALAMLRAAVHARREEVLEIRRLLDNVDRAERALTSAERLLLDAEATEEAALAATIDTRAERDQTAATWRDDLNGWTASLDAHRRAHDVTATTPPLPDIAELIERRSGIATARTGGAQLMVDLHAQRVATLRAAMPNAQAALDSSEHELARLMAMSLPDPPLAPWQIPASNARLAECIDFAPGVEPAARAGIEAALEASTLLAAEVTADGDALVEGQLLVRAGAPATNSLIALLVVTAPPGVQDTATDAIVRVLRTISIDPHDLDRPADCTVITTDGRFRLGALRGRHHKDEAEHIGVTARRALLERQRADARAAAALATGVLASIVDDLASASDAARYATELRDTLPSIQVLDRAVLHVTVADRQLIEVAERTGRHRSARNDAELALADASAGVRRAAATANLPHDRVGLDRTEVELRDTAATCGQVDAALTTFARSVRLWASRGREWQQAVDDAHHATRAQEQLQQRRESVATRLATLEDAVGLAYREIVAAIDVSTNDRHLADSVLREHREQLPGLEKQVGRLEGAVATAIRDHEAAEQGCAHAIDGLRRTLDVPGLVEAAQLIAARAEAGGEPDAASLRTLAAVERNAHGLQSIAHRIRTDVVAPERPTNADGVRGSLRQRRDALGAGWDAEDRQPSIDAPLLVEVTGPLGRMPLRDSLLLVRSQVRAMSELMSAKQDQALRNLLQGLIAREVAEKLLAGRELVTLMNRRLDAITTAHGIGVSLRWRRRDDLDPALVATIDLLSKRIDLRTADENTELLAALSTRIANARAEDPEAPYRQLIASVLDYREWHRMQIILRRPGREDERLTRRTALSEGEKKVVSYLPLFAAVAASCDALAEIAPNAPRFVLLDDAFAKVSEDNHPKLFGLLVELDLDFIATSERLWGTYAAVPQLAITEVIRDAGLGVIVLEHALWDGHVRVDVA
jgi:uncharacterized protein (TIGR02680 family)